MKFVCTEVQVSWTGPELLGVWRSPGFQALRFSGFEATGCGLDEPSLPQDLKTWKPCLVEGTNLSHPLYGERTVSRVETVMVETMVETRIALETRST